MRFIRFGVVGTIGFVVDTSVLYFAVYELKFGLYYGRVISYLVAVTVTWALNRRYTFQSRDSNLKNEWTRFTVLNLGGGVINYLVYAILVHTFGIVAEWPVIGVAAGSLAGMCSNYWLSLKYVFTDRSGKSSELPDNKII